MLPKTRFVTLVLFGLLSCSCLHASERELSLEEAFHLAEKTSPQIRASYAQEEQAQAGSVIARSSYYPSLDFGLIESTGFPGSTGGATGVGGLMASPFRSGIAAGVFSRIALLDLGRDYAAQEASRRVALSERQAKVDQASVDQQALETFLEAARMRAQVETYVFLQQEAEKVSEVVNRLVKTGQHSVVSKLLVEDQVTDAKLKRVDFEKRYAAALDRLALLTGLPAQRIACPSSVQLTESSLSFLGPPGTNPLLQRAEQAVQVAHSGVSASQAQSLPKVIAVGSAGVMQSARLVQKNDYSVGIGLDLPLFEGFRIHAETAQARARVQERESEVEQIQLEVDELDSRYEQAIASARERLKMMADEREASIKALKLAKYRYRMYQGLLVDVREALRNLGRIQSEIDDAQADLLLALGSRAILHGALAR